MKCSSCESDLEDGEIFWCAPCQESYLRDSSENHVKKMMDNFRNGILNKKFNPYDVGDFINFGNRRGIILDIEDNFYTIKFNNGKIEVLNENVLIKSSKEILLEYLEEMNYKIECENILNSLTLVIDNVRNIYGKKINSGIDLVNYCFNEEY